MGAERTCVACEGPLRPKQAKACSPACYLRHRTEVATNSVAARFWSKVTRGDGCWEWVAAINPVTGYGAFGVGRAVVNAHRLSWEMANGRSVPAGHDVCHRCDNRRCVRPDHLFVASRAANVADMFLKGRNKPRGPARVSP